MEAQFGFSLSETALDIAVLPKGLRHPASGGFVTFEGWVRNHNDGKQVACLEYEAYARLAQTEGEAVIEEARARFAINGAWCVHRTGKLEIGECAVWIGTCAPHRGEAFAACRYIIDEIKHRLPIWKREHYVSGECEWVNCAHCAAHGHHGSPDGEQTVPDGYYARQVCVKEIGASGQDRLLQSRVLVVGAGGLASGALPALAAAGIGAIGIVDDDQVELSNLHRQTLYAPSDLGKDKAHCAAERLRAQAPWLRITPHVARFSHQNALELIGDYELVVDCTDNFEAKFAINDACAHLRKSLVSAGIYQYEGQVFSYRGEESGPCLRCLWGDEPGTDCTDNCSNAGTLGTVPTVFGALQAMEAVKLLLGLPGTLNGEVLIHDLMNLSSRRIRVPVRTDCPACQRREWLAKPSSLEISYESARSCGCCIFDLRPEVERLDRPVPGTFPFTGEDDPRLQESLLRGQPVALMCSHGLRSRSLARAFRQQGFGRVYSIYGQFRELSAGSVRRSDRLRAEG